MPEALQHGTAAGRTPRLVEIPPTTQFRVDLMTPQPPHRLCVNQDLQRVLLHDPARRGSGTKFRRSRTLASVSATRTQPALAPPGAARTPRQVRAEARRLGALRLAPVAMAWVTRRINARRRWFRGQRRRNSWTRIVQKGRSVGCVVAPRIGLRTTRSFRSPAWRRLCRRRALGRGAEPMFLKRLRWPEVRSLRRMHFSRVLGIPLRRTRRRMLVSISGSMELAGSETNVGTNMLTSLRDLPAPQPFAVRYKVAIVRLPTKSRCWFM